MVRRRIGSAVVAVVLATLSTVVPAPAPAAAAEAPPVFVDTWGSQGPGESQFVYPWGIVIDSHGDLFIADRDNHRMQKFSSSGDFLGQWGTWGGGPGQFRNPYGVAVNAEDQVFVVDTANNRIQVFNNEGTFLYQWGSHGTGNGQFADPQGVAVAGDGTVYVSDGANHRVQRFTPDGTYMSQWGLPGPGTRPGRFNYPRDVAVDAAGNVFVADTKNHRVQRFTADGRFVTQWGGYGTIAGKLRYPFAIRVDAAGAVYVADYDNHRIQKFTANGAFVHEWGGEGSGPGQFRHPQGLAVDAAGNVYVSDADNHRVQKFAPASALGSVAGTVTESGTGDPVDGAWLAVLRTSDFSIAGSAVADGSGAFDAVVPAGSYFVYVVDPSGRHQTGFHGAPRRISVPSGGAATVDPTVASLRGQVTGTISEVGTNTALPGAWALSLRLADGAVEAAAVASGAGGYTLDGLAPGRRFVGWVDPTGGHATRFSPDSASLPGATTLTVRAGATTSANGSLPTTAVNRGGSALAGTVVAAGTSAPLAGVHVVALRAADFAMARGAITNASGDYSLNVAPGSYFVAFFDATAEHATEWFNDQPATGLAAATPVTAPGTADAALAVTRGSVDGTVTDADTGVPLAGAWVLAIGPAGPAGGAVTAPDGSYDIDGLVPGTYRVAFVDPQGGRRQEFWNDSTDYAGATVVAVVAGTGVTRNGALALP